MTYTTTNATLAAILSASVTIKPKNGESYTTTVGEDGVKHLPKVSEIKDESAVKAFKAIGNAYDFIVKARTAPMGSKLAIENTEKATDCLREYLSEIGLPTTEDCLDALKAINALKASKVKGTDDYVPTSTGRATFQKNVLKITCLAIEAGSWNVAKVSKNTIATNVTTPEGMARVLADQFGFDYDIMLKKLTEAKAA